MQCLQCDQKLFTAKTVLMPDKAGQNIPVTAWVCETCNEPYMDSNQMNAYLEKHKGVK